MVLYERTDKDWVILDACFLFFIVYLTESEVIHAVNVKMNWLMNLSVNSIDVLVTI